MREIAVYLVSGLASLFILGYSVHIFVGGLVDERTEAIAIAVVEAVALGVIGWMAYDVVRRRKGGS